MKTLVTGASGFLGSAVLRRLLRAGHDVRALMRPNSNRRNIEGLAVETVMGDLSDPSSFGAALKGCDALFHVAADYRLWVPDPDDMYTINVDGTRELMRAALRAGVQRIVYTSSVATLGLNSNGTPADEETPVGLDDMIGHYKRSKYMADIDLDSQEQAPAPKRSQLAQTPGVNGKHYQSTRVRPRRQHCCRWYTGSAEHRATTGQAVARNAPQTGQAGSETLTRFVTRPGPPHTPSLG